MGEGHDHDHPHGHAHDHGEAAGVDKLAVLALIRSCTQASEVLDGIGPDDLARPTPCAEWDVAALANHLLAAPRIFITMLQGRPPGWGREVLTEDFGEEFRRRGNVLINLWRETTVAPMVDPDWHSAEIAVHTWDLATALGIPTDGFDQQVAERAVVAMDRILGPQRTGRAFADARQAPARASAYDHLAAYAGRVVPWERPAG